MGVIGINHGKREYFYHKKILPQIIIVSMGVIDYVSL